jgi:hypothetical protein
MNFLEKLKIYFETTPKEQIQSDWDSTAEFDQDYPFEIYLPSMENKTIRFEWKKGEAYVLGMTCWAREGRLSCGMIMPEMQPWLTGVQVDVMRCASSDMKSMS